MTGCQFFIVRFAFQRLGGDANAAGLFLIENLIGARRKERLELIEITLLIGIYE